MKKEIKSKGFSLVETLVSIVIFGLISVALINIFISGVKGQSRILQNQELMEQSSYSLEYMSKMIRMAEKDETGDCTGSANDNYGLGGAGEYSITFLAYDSKDNDYKCRKFILDDDKIKEQKSTDTTADNLGSMIALTASTVKVNELVFSVSGDNGDDDIQPKVTLKINMQTNILGTNQPTLIIQTSISQRHLDLYN